MASPENVLISRGIPVFDKLDTEPEAQTAAVASPRRYPLVSFHGRPCLVCGGRKGPLLLFRKLSGPGIHSTALPKEATANDLTVHLWLICAGVSGMDVADVR